MILRGNWHYARRNAIQFLQGALSPVPDWKGNVPEDPSRQACLEKISPSLGTVWLSINQKNERALYSKFLLTVLME
jgi:hypothetical protein